MMVKFKDVYNYIQGTLRYRLYYSKYQNLIRKHIRDQIDFRIKVMNKECYNSGSCVECGCKTTALQMCNKSCDGNCYPPMLGSIDWFTFSCWGFTHIKFQLLGDNEDNWEGKDLYYNGKLIKTLKK